MITIVQQPQRFTPSNNPIIFQVESDQENILYFKVDVMEASSGAIIHKEEYEVRPDYKKGTVIQLNKVLTNFVKWQVDNSLNNMVMPMANTLLEYKLKITERGIVNGLISDIGTSYTSPLSYFTWEAEMNSFLFDAYNQQDWLITVGLPAKFLTNKPDNSVVNDYSAEQLYFMHETEDKLGVVVKTYDTNNQLLTVVTQDIPNLDKYKMFRVQVSPKALQEAQLIDFSLVKYYTIHIQDENGNQRTEKRTYWYKELPCNVEPTNLIWVNPMGGVESFQFLNVQATTNITRNTIKKNFYKFHKGLYSNRTDEMLNPMEEVINISKSGSYTCYSGFITDEESEWFNEMFTSKQVFVELADESLVPVIITNNSYQVQKQKYNKSSFISISVTYTINGDIIPTKKVSVSGSKDFGNGLLQSDFIDKQMNGWAVYNTILLFPSNVIDGKEGVGGTVASPDDKLKFEFNKIFPLLGLPQTMLIHVDGVETIVIDFMGDYSGKEFRFTDKTGSEYTSTFVNGSKYF